MNITLVEYYKSEKEKMNEWMNILHWAMEYPEEKSIFKPIEKIKLDSIGILNTKLTLDEISIVMNQNVGWLKLIRNFQSYWIGNPIE